MNTNAARNTQVLRMIEKALAPESFVSDPFLISRFAKKNALPISDLLAQRDFIANLVDADEIVDTLKNSQKYVALQDSDVDEFLIYFYNFAIYPNMLVLKQISQEEYRSEIQFYIEKICGNNRFMIYNSTNNTDLYVYFNAFEDCIAFWRGTKYFPFLGRIFIKTEIYSQWSALLQAENNHNMNYNFHQNRNGQNRRNYQNNHNYNNNHHNSSHNVNYYNSHNANHNGVTNINHGNNNSNNSNHNNNSNSVNISNSSNNGNNNGYHNSSYHNNGNSNDYHSSGGSQQRGGRSQQRGPIQIRTGQQQQPARAGMQPQQPHRSNSQRSVSQQRSYQSQKGGGSRQSRNNNQISMQQQPQPQMPSQTHSNQNSPQNGSTTNYSNNSNFSNSPYMTQNNNQYAGQADQNSSKQNQVHVQPPGRPQTPQQTFNHNRQKNSQIFQWQPQTQSPNSQQNQQQSQGQQQQQNNQQQLQSQENNDATDDHIMRSAPTSPKVQKRRQYHQFPKKK